MAEGILKDKAKKAGLDWFVDSAGTLGYNVGSPPHQLSQKVAKEYGVDICAQKCRAFVADDLQLFDRIYVMDEENYAEVKNIAGKAWNAGKVDYLLNTLYPGQNKSIPDPFYANEAGFHTVYELIAEACDKLVADYTTT